MAQDVAGLLIAADDKLSGPTKAAARSLEDLAAQAAEADVRIRTTTKSADGLAKAYIATERAAAELSRAKKRLAADQDSLNRQMEAGKVTAERAAQIQDGIRKREADAVAKYQAQLKALGQESTTTSERIRLQSHEVTNLSFQLQDLAVQIGSGGGIFRPLLQQGPQAIGAVGGLSRAAQLVGQTLSGTTGVIVGTTAAVAALAGGFALAIARAADLQNETRQFGVILRGFNRDAELSAATLSNFSRALERQGVSRTDARGAVSTLARTQGLPTEIAGTINGLAVDYGRVTGNDPAQAMQALAQAATSGWDGIKKLDEALNFLNTRERESVRTMLEHGQRTEGLRVAFDALGRQIRGLNEEALMPSERAWNSLGNAWSRFADAIAQSRPVQIALAAIAASMNAIASVVEGPSARPGNVATDTEANLDLARGRLQQFQELTARYQNRDAPLGIMPSGFTGLGSSVSEIETNLRRQVEELEKALDLDRNRAAQMQAQAAAASATTQQLRTQNAMAPGADGTPAEGLTLPQTGEQRRQAGVLSDARASWQNRAAVVRAGPNGAVVAAEQRAREQAASRGLSGLAFDSFVRGETGAARLEAGAGAGQSLAALTREAEGHLAVARAAEQGLAPMLRASAAAKAHAQAATQAGMAEGELARRILDRDAAQEAEKGAETVRTLRLQAEAAAKLADAAQYGPAAEAAAQLDERIRAATERMVSYAEVARDPAVAQKLREQAEQVRAIMTAQDASNKLLRDRRALVEQGYQRDIVEAEARLVGESVVVRERELAALRERQKILRDGGDPESSDGQQRINGARDLSDRTRATNRLRDAYSELQNIGTQAFDRIGSAITEAFTTGNTKAINFLSIGKAVISELLQGFLKLAVVNPLKNAVFGSNSGTLSDLAGAAGGTGGGYLGAALRFIGFGGSSGGASAGGGAAMTLAQAETILRGGSVSGFTSASGGDGFSLGSVGNLLSGGRSIWNAFSGGTSNTGIGFVDRALNYQLFGSGYGGALPAGFAEGTAAAYGPGLSGVGGLDAPYSSALSVGGDGVGATLGGALGAAGSIFSGITGFMRGGTGGIIQGVGGVVGGGMQIASMMGLGSMLGPWGMAIAAIASILGSLFGGKKAFSGGAITVGPAASNGLLSILGVASKNYNASEDVKKMQEDLDKFNKELTDRSIKINVDTIGTVTQDRFLTTAGVPMFKQGLGQGASGASTWEDVYKAIAANLKSDVNPGTNFVLNVGRQRGYDLETQLLNVDWNQKVYEPMVVKTREVTDEFSKALKELDDSMLPVIDKARDLGLATDELTAYLAKATRDITEQRDAQTFGLTGGLEVRRLRALGDAQGADLLAYDVQAQQEAYSFRKSLEQVGLEAGALAEQMQKLRDVQAIERDVIVANAAANAGAAASGKINTGVISSLTDYAHSLRTSDMSPGTPFDRLSEAERRFNAVAGAAAAGDAASMSAFQGYANEYLTASRSVYGSGTGFASAFSRVTDYIDRIGQQQANELTAAVFNAGNAALSAAVVAAIERLQDEVAALRRETKQVSTAPDRSAA